MSASGPRGNRSLHAACQADGFSAVTMRRVQREEV
jgi:hypothetical protein